MPASSLDVSFMVENVVPELRDQFRTVLTPQGSGPVAQSPHFQFIVCHLLQGTVPEVVASLLARERKQVMAPHVIRDYMLAYIPATLLRPNMVLKYFSQMPVLPELATIETAIKMQAMKVAKMFDLPMNSVEERESSRRDLELLVRTCEVALEIKVDMGLVHKGPQPEIPVQHHVHEHKITMEPRKAANALAALKEIRNLNPKPQDVS